MPDRRWTVAALPLLLALASCDKGVPAPAKMDPVTMDEAKRLATDFQAAVTPCDGAKVDPLIDGENLIRRAIQKSTVKGSMRDGIAKGMRSNSVGRMLCQGWGADATYTLLRIREVDGQPRPLFRLISDDAVNYHELELGKSRSDHRVRVVDVRIFASGDLLSESLTQMLDQAAATMKSGADPADFRRTGQELRDARERGDNVEARRLLSTLPEPMRRSKPMRLAELMIASDLDEATYADIMEKYRHDFPDDPSGDVLAIDYFYLKKDMTQTLAAVDRLDQLVGGDPYLAVLRANAHLLEPTPEHLAEAERWARKATTAEPTNENGWWTLAAILLQRGDHTAVVAVADTLRTRFAATIDPVAMAGNDLWSAHFDSPAYRAWQTQHPSSPTAPTVE
jgi:hypothetical protein